MTEGHGSELTILKKGQQDGVEGRRSASVSSEVGYSNSSHLDDYRDLPERGNSDDGNSDPTCSSLST